MDLTKDNVFLGATVNHRTESENLFVYKINDKSFYAGPITLKELEEHKEANNYSSFSKLMEAVGGKLYQYKDFVLVDTKVENKNQKQYLTKPAESLIKKLYQIKKSGKGSWDHSNFVNKVHTTLVAANNKGQCVVRSGNDLVFYDVETEAQQLFNLQKDKFGKKIIWENFQIS